jgi:uncharacterized protein YhbP (UPF0306 family)
MTEVLTTSHFAYLCTTDRSNQPHITPMFFVFDEKTCNVYVMASSESKKMRNIHENPKVSLSVDIRDEKNPFNNRGVMVQGRAEVHYAIDSLFALDDKAIVQAYEDFKRKYPVLQTVRSAIVDEYHKFSENLVTIAPRRMVYWRGLKFITVNFDKKNL